MKPANEIEIKRNIYSFSVLVLLLSVLIGSSAWTVLGGAGAKWEQQLVKRDETINSLESVVGARDSLLKGAQDSVARLQAQLAAAKNNDLPRQVQSVTDFLDKASNMKGKTLEDYVEYKKPTLGDSADALVWDLLNSVCLTLETQGGIVKRLEEHPEKGNKSNDAGATASRSNEAKGNSPTGDCEAQVKGARDEAEKEITNLKELLKAINKTRLEGLNELTKEGKLATRDGNVVTAITIDEATEEEFLAAMKAKAFDNRQKSAAVWGEYYNLLLAVRKNTKGIQ